MIRRNLIVAMSGSLVAGLALAFVGCSESAPPPGPATPQPVAQPEPKPTARKGKKAKNPFADMGIREKREWRKQQRAAGEATGQTP